MTKANMQIFVATVDNKYPVVKFVISEPASDKCCVLESSGEGYFKTGNLMIDASLSSSKDLKDMIVNHTLLISDVIEIEELEEGSMDRITKEQLMEEISKVQTEEGLENFKPVYQLFVNIFDEWQRLNSNEVV
jgi:hypothetical protein